MGSGRVDSTKKLPIAYAHTFCYVYESVRRTERRSIGYCMLLLLLEQHACVISWLPSCFGFYFVAPQGHGSTAIYVTSSLVDFVLLGASGPTKVVAGRGAA